MSIDLSVVIPAFREEQRLGPTLERILGYLEGRGGRFEVLVVDDGSDDGTAAVAESFAGRGVRTLRLGSNRGKGAALREGVLASRGAWVLLTDADLSAPIEELERLEARAEEADLVLGSRAVAGARITRRQPLFRELMGKAFNLVLRALGLVEMRDTQCGFKLLRGDSARALFDRLRVEGFAYDVELVWLASRGGYRVVEAGVSWRDVPESKVHPLRDSARMLWDVLRLRLRRSHEPGPLPGNGGAIGRPTLVLLALLLVWSLSLRIWFGTPDLNVTRFWDERYGLENIASLLTGGGLRPANGFHPSLSYLPQALLLGASQALHRLTGVEIFAVFADPGFTPAAYLLCRVSQAVLGTLSLLAVFLIGRRLADDRVGLVAALLLAVVPWHVRQSAIFKPDILLVLTVLFAFLLSLAATARPSPRAYLAAGAAIGLALASKFNAGPIALPLTLAAAFEVRRNRRVLLWLVLAGAVATAVFLLLSPYVLLEPEIYQRSFGRTLRDYARKGAARGGGSPLHLVGHAVSSLLGGTFHGPWIGALGLAGLALLGALSLRRRRESPRARGWLMTLIYVVGYVGAYSLSTSNPSAHNWLVLTPFVALAAARVLVALWEAGRRLVPPLARPALAAPVVGLAVLAVAWPANEYAYATVVPTTADLAGRLLVHRARDVSGRIVYSELAIGSRALRRGPRSAALARVSELRELSASELDLADAEVFLARRLGRDDADRFYRRRLEGAGEQGRHSIAGRPFRARGPSLVLLVHPWRRGRDGGAGQWLPLPGEDRRYASDALAALPRRQIVSLEFSLPDTGGTTRGAGLRIGGRELESIPYRRSRRRVLHVTPRFPVGDRPRLELILPAGSGDEERIPFVIRHWRRPRLAERSG